MEVEQTEAEEASISKEEFKEWYGNKVTQFVIAKLTAERDGFMFSLANGRTIVKDPDFTTEYAVGRIQGINDFVLIEYEDSREEKVAQGRDNYAY